MPVKTETRGTQVFEFRAEEFQNGDVHLCRMIASMALAHRDYSVTYPDDLDPQTWKAILTDIAGPLLAYADGKFTDSTTARDEAVLEANAKAAILLFADWFNAFWD